MIPARWAERYRQQPWYFYSELPTTKHEKILGTLLFHIKDILKKIFLSKVFLQCVELYIEGLFS